MKKLTFAICLLCLMAGTANAYDWALQFGARGGWLAPTGDEWNELYHDETQGFAGGYIDVELFHGLGPYLAGGAVWAESAWYEDIDVEFYTQDISLGLNGRWFVTPWLAPNVRAGVLAFRAMEEIRDDFVKINMEHEGIGFEVGAGLLFYPFAPFKNWASGFAFGFEGLYQHRPLEGMGNLQDASGIGGAFVLGYRWDFHPSESAQ
ncbi:MAG: hypothetical protein P9L99_18650 [Candidatus Lernaella stagnicola]|nr:hypothetical protein [Candidatus Lernaella stagnicola]